ncbi:MAG TPA: hypothetical protein VNF29_10745 [Candidatus Binataceae bacterium]|nr:hypothetical protein [Candidatus Binataceae bacterium]
MNRVAILISSLLIIAPFHWISVAAVPANAAGVAPDYQAVTIPAPAPSAHPSAAPTAASDETSTQVLTIPLPETFAGCWSGDVRHLDSRHSYKWWWPSWSLYWFDKTYTVCFNRRGLNEWNVGFASTAVDPTRDATLFQVTQTKPSRVLAIRMTGPQSAAIDLTADIRFGPGIKTENTHLECSLGSARSMAVTGSMEEFRNGSEGMSATWHAEFQPVAGGDADGSGSVDAAPVR